ncbi:MAG: cob(I)yrinic acid a,c-diamide adenosyltransferase [Anaerolineae bacterium]|nr:MAG: cob(I)yrinic acid a,c-diamide adenosyltransferase [Anaerolineae bacterium]
MTPNVKHGLTIVHTGDGKGKSTAAFGMVLRAWGRGFRVCVIQFLKNESGKWGEVLAAQRLGIEWHISGDGFTWTSKDMDATIARAQLGWELAKEKIACGQYDLIVLDEFTYPLSFGWLDLPETIAWLKAYKPAHLHLVITGRNAPPELLDYADLVSESREVKHPFRKGLKAQPGIEF